MKNPFALMLALALACPFVACDDDDDEDDTVVVSQSTTYYGTSSATVMGISLSNDNDSVIIEPMSTNKDMAQIVFPEREMTVQMGVTSMTVGMGGFKVDSLVCQKTGNGFVMSRKNASFSVSGVKVSMSGKESEQTVAGDFTEASVENGTLTLQIDNVQAHSQMPVRMTISFEGKSK